MDAGPGPGSLSTTSLNGNEQLDWHFLQCFGERTPGEEIQDGRPIQKQNQSELSGACWLTAAEYEAQTK